VTRDEWDGLRYKFNLEHGVTNVWRHPALRGQERVRDATGVFVHSNQKPLVFMRRIIGAVTGPGDVVWEPFGGLCSAVTAAIELGRRGFAAETDERFYRLAVDRVEDHFT